jgi:hypothetical protein
VTSFPAPVVRPDVVPGWWLDHALGEVAGCALYAARRAAALQPGSPPEYATVLLAAGDGAARAALGMLGDPVPADALPLALEGAPVALVLAPHIGPGLAPAPQHAASTPPTSPVEAVAVAAPTVSPNDPENVVVAPRATLAGTSALVALLVVVVVVVSVVVVLRDRTTAAAADPVDETAIRWDAETATATVVQQGETHRFVLGAPGDQLVVGDWDGDRVRTPGLYRSSTGELWVFDRWAVEGEPAGARALERGVVLGRAKVVRRDGRDTIVVETSGG